LKKKQQLAPSRESDLNNDDDLWNAVLGLSKSSVNTQSPSLPEDTSSVNGDDNASSGDEGNEKSVAKFMEFLDAQQTKFRADTLASLETFMAAKSNNNDSGPPPRPMNESRKISFDLSMKSDSSKGPLTKGAAPSPSALQRRSTAPIHTSTSTTQPPTPPDSHSFESGSPFFPFGPTNNSTSTNTTSRINTSNLFANESYDSDESENIVEHKDDNKP
jgi:hypothetical protein